MTKHGNNNVVLAVRMRSIASKIIWVDENNVLQGEVNLSVELIRIAEELEKSTTRLDIIDEYIEGRIEHAQSHVGEGWEQVIRELQVVRDRLSEE